MVCKILNLHIAADYQIPTPIYKFVPLRELCAGAGLIKLYSFLMAGYTRHTDSYCVRS